jgi:replicative DNA helicase
LGDVLPQATDAEEQVLGACLMSTKAAEKAVDSLTEDCFFLESHGKMFSVIEDMVSNGVPTDVVTVAAALKEKGLTEETGGRIRLHELVGLTPATANVHHHIRLVRDAWKRRLVLKAVTSIQSEIDTLSADEAVAALDKAALEIEEVTDSKHDLVVDIKDLIEAKRQAMDNPQFTKAGVPSPYSFLPELAGGRLYVLGGYMGDGKTAACLQFAATAAEAGEKVGIASAEMSKQDLFDRWACQRTGIDYWRVKNPHLLDLRQRETLTNALTVMEDWKVDVIDDESLDPGKLRRYQRAGKYDLLLVDHLHRMRWKDRHDLENNIRAITNIAREFEVPVVLLAQLSRAGDYAKPFPVPSMRQLRETAMLEAEASAVWFVYRERDENHVQTNRSQFIVAKNRYGRVGTEVLYFDDASQSFEERGWEPVEQEAPTGLVKF